MWRRCWNVTVPPPAGASLQREKEGTGGGLPRGTRALGGTVLTVKENTGIVEPAETFSPQPPLKVVIINLSPFSPVKREAGTKNIPAKSVSFLEDGKLPTASEGKNS